MKITYHIYKDCQVKFTGESDEQIFASPKYKKIFAQKRYSFVSMCWHPGARKLFLGTTNSGGDLLVQFDPATGKFRSCGYQRAGWWDATEAKIHKGIWLDEKEDALYFGTSTLSPVSKTIESRGGKLVRYWVKERKFELIATPTPGDFYQATGYDRGRRKMYFYTDPGLCFGVYDLRKKKLVRYNPMESIVHIGCIDDEGGAWGTCGASRHEFFRYLPDENRYEFPNGCAFPEALRAADVMYIGAGPVDSFLNGKDGYLYAGSALGEVIRLDPISKEIKYLGKPFGGKRLPGMALAEDGMIYCCGGSDGASMLARYDRDLGRFEYLGPVAAADGTVCYRCHEIVVVDGVAYIGETDNRRRSGYLWACHLV